MKLSTEGLPCMASSGGRENVMMMFTDVSFGEPENIFESVSFSIKCGAET